MPLLNTLLIIGASFVSQALVAAYVYGKTTQNVANQKEQTNKLEKKVDDHETRISHLEGAHI